MKYSCPRWFMIAAALLLLAATIFWARNEFSTFNDPPGSQRDDVFYENIAFNLTKGKGYSLDFANEEWLQPYLAANSDGSRDWILGIRADGPTATRPPVWPSLMAGSYQLFGRRFDVLRWMNIALVTIGLTFLLCTVYRFYGAATATMAAITISFDFAVLRTPGQLMTEAIAIAWMSILFAFCARMFFVPKESVNGHTPIGRWIILGIGLGVLSLIRTNVAGWICLIVAAGTVYVVYKLARQQDGKTVVVRMGCLILGVLMVAGPWWARNCYVTGHLQPFGTASSIGIAGYYSDGAFQNGGDWDIDAVRQARTAAFEKHDIKQLTMAQQEYLVGVEGRKSAGKWISENRDKLPKLFLLRTGRHLGILSDFHPALIAVNCLILFGALIGILVDRQWGRWIGIIFLLSLTVTVLTICHSGRYSIPIRPLWHVACAIGTVWFWTMVLGYFSNKDPVERPG